LLAALTALFMGIGFFDRRPERHDHRPAHRRRDEPVHLLERRQDGALDVRRARGRTSVRRRSSTRW
jgi:hypothetical protein